MKLKTEAMAIRDSDTPSVSDIAACKFYLPISQTSGATLTDTVGGVIYTPTTVSYANGAALLNDAAVLTATGGTLPTIADTSDWVFILAFKTEATAAATSLFTFGNPAASINDIGFRQNTAGTAVCVVADGSAEVTVTNSTVNANATDYLVVMSNDQSSATGFNVTVATTAAATDMTPGNASSLGASTLGTNNGIRCLGMRLYGVALFEFTSNGLPANWKSAGLALADQWRLGNKVITNQINSGSWVTG